MLTEEALILLATLAATGLLVLGVLELVWPTTPRTRVHRPPVVPPVVPRARPPFEGLLAPRDATPSVIEPDAPEGGSTRRPPESTADATEVPERIAAGPDDADAASHAMPATASAVAPAAPIDEALASSEPSHESRDVATGSLATGTPAPPADAEAAPPVESTPGDPGGAERVPLVAPTAPPADASRAPVADPAAARRADAADASTAARAEPASTSAPHPAPAPSGEDALADSTATVDAGSVSRVDAGVASAPALPIGAPTEDTLPRVVASAAASPASQRDTTDTGEPVASAPPVRREPRPHVLPIETCVAMFDEGRYAEVVSLGSAALEVHAKLGRVTDRAGEAALIALVGRSKHQLGDRDGARAACNAAVRAAEPSLRPMYVAHVVELARAAVDAMPADDAPAGADAAVAQLRELVESAASLDDALDVVPGDASLEGARTAVREALASACERLVDAIVAGEGGRDARTLVARALADDSMPAAWRQRVGEQLTPISSAEIGQLTAQAIRCVQEGRDGDAIAALERAERLFSALPPGTVPDERLEEFERRLWWGYTKVGLSRIDTERYEDAVEPLFRALHLSGIDDQRLGETRDALVGAIESLVEEVSAVAAARGPEGVAPDQVDRLTVLLRGAVERGVGEDQLGDAFAKLEALKRTLSQT